MTVRRRIKTVQSFLRQRRDALNFDAIPDGRDPRGQRWALGALLSTAVLGMMMLARSLRAAEDLSEDLAGARGVPRAQVALAWLLHQDAVTAPIVGVTKERHVTDAVAAVELELSEAELGQLEEHYVPRAPEGY